MMCGQGYINRSRLALLWPGYAASRDFMQPEAAEGVSLATTQAVVMCSVLILVWDYLLGSLLF